jgi:pyruvate,water dikinase
MVYFATWFAEVGAADAGAVGGKGASLGELTRAGVAVPPGFVVTTAGFGEAMAVVDPIGRQRGRVARLDPDDLTAVTQVTGELRRRIGYLPVPDPVRRTVSAHYRSLSASERSSEASDAAGFAAGAVAVRSSATGEDSADASYAGLQDTYLWVRGEEAVLSYLRRCWASLYSVESVCYRRRHGLPEPELAMAVVVQRMVDPRCAGVMFTRSPLTGDRSVVAIEATWGLGSALVGGDVTPDRFAVNKVTGEVVTRAVSRKLRQHLPDPAGTGICERDVPPSRVDACCLTDAELGDLVRVAKRIEAHYRAPQDIEWAIAGDDIYVLQSRPETVWAQRDAAAVPVVPVRPRALDHVLDVLGGRAAWG